MSYEIIMCLDLGDLGEQDILARFESDEEDISLLEVQLLITGTDILPYLVPGAVKMILDHIEYTGGNQNE